MDLPLKIIVPTDPNLKQFAMIGLGDIIIPGLLSSMCLRCDLINAFNTGKVKAIKEGVRDKELLMPYIEKEMESFYFKSSLFGFFVGIVLTYFAMIVTQRP